MSPARTRTLLLVYLLLLVPVGWLATAFEPFQVDGDAVAYMDLADLIHAHRWAGVVNGYWHPFYPALLAAGQAVLKPSRQTELGTYYAVNFVIFLAEIAAMWWFAGALDSLRSHGETNSLRLRGTGLLDRNALRLLGIALVVIAAQRELSMGKVRPDALLQALMLCAFAAMLAALAGKSLWSPALMGMFFGLAYLTKSFAFVIALFSLAAVVAVQLAWQRRPRRHVVAGGTLALLTFAAFAGPYVAALSRQKGRFDFGDSGALNYAWYAGGVEKMHLEPWMTASFGHATVAMRHPEEQLLASPDVYSYRAETYGTYPAWFDTTFFNERITPHLNLPVLLRRDSRNVVLVFRYLLNHPEGWLLLGLLLWTGARPRLAFDRSALFWIVPVSLGLLMWGLYGLVNIEERYVTLAYLLVLLPVFALLRQPQPGAEIQPAAEIQPGAETTAFTPASRLPAHSAVALLAVLALGNSLRLALEARRTSLHLPHPWYSPEEFGAARALAGLGIGTGDEVACMGTAACLNQEYWARLADVRILTEVYNPNAAHLLEQWNGLDNRAEVIATLRGEGARVLVASFDPGVAASDAPDPENARSTLRAWIRLGDTSFFALPLRLRALDGVYRASAESSGNGLLHPPAIAPALPWDTHRGGGP